MISRTEILKKANECVCGDREQDYGSPEDNFGIIAKLWSTYLGTDISAVDVAMMMAMLKIARIKSGRLHEDNFVDLAGYAACAGEIASNPYVADDEEDDCVRVCVLTREEVEKLKKEMEEVGK